MAFDLQIAWAAGVIEGEGCLTVVKNSKAKQGRSPKILVQMNDHDIVNRLQDIFDVGKIYVRPPKGRSKQSYTWTVYKAKDIEHVLDLIYPWLGERRKKKADEVLAWINQ